ncbi:MAG: Kinase binding protein CGI-121 [Methanosaeta sp. PtaB.Bin039]|nr:MAG: Kinase binding protein CGI-121 [Methanosaeta sp. PtaB.Bin039]
MRVRLIFGRPCEDMLTAVKRLRSQGYLIQAFDASLVVSADHLWYAAQKAMQAMSQGRNVARDLGIEILRYASGQRQIGKALQMGITQETERVAVVAVGDIEEELLAGLVEQDGRDISFDRGRVMAYFEISDIELEAAGNERIADLVLERVALVNAYR